MGFEITKDDLLLVETAYKKKEIFNGLLHGADHIKHISDYANKLLEQLTLSQGEIDVIKYSILLHDSGRVTDKQDDRHHFVSCRIANDFIQDHNVDINSKWVCDVIIRHTFEDNSKSMVESVVRTADRLDVLRFPKAKVKEELLDTFIAWRDVLEYAYEVRRKYATLE